MRTITINSILLNGTTVFNNIDLLAPKQQALEFAGWWIIGTITIYFISFL